jgi:hypothetical protein
MRFAFGDTLGKGFMKTVNFVLICFLLIDCPSVQIQFIFDNMVLTVVQLPLQIQQLSIGDSFLPFAGFLCLFRPFGMTPVVSVPQELFAFPAVTPAQLNFSFLNNPVNILSKKLVESYEKRIQELEVEIQGLEEKLLVSDS